MVHIPTWMAKLVRKIMQMATLYYTYNLFLLQIWSTCTLLVYALRGKTQLFQENINIFGNYINLANILAKRHQQMICYKMLNTTTYLSQETYYGKGESKYCMYVRIAVIQILYVLSTNTVGTDTSFNLYILHTTATHQYHMYSIDISPHNTYMYFTLH